MRERRLRKSAQFTACYEGGEKYFTSSFVLFIRPRATEHTDFRLGLTVSRKTGNAVVRNRVKRVVREFFRLHQHDFEGACDIVVVPKRKLNPAQLDLAQATHELVPALERVFSRLPDQTRGD